MAVHATTSGSWPELHGAALRATLDTEHRWLQVLGKVRLALAPFVNHYWQATLYVTPRGLTTSALPFARGTFTLELDFIDHKLRAVTSDGGSYCFPLGNEPIAVFYARTFAVLRDLGIDVDIWPVPVEIDDRTRMDRDARPRVYDRRQATS